VKPIYRCRVCNSFTEDPVHCNSSCELILTGRQRLKLSKLLSLILRHKPEIVNLRLGEDGFVSIDELVGKIKQYLPRRRFYSWLKPLHIYAVAATCPKGRFEVKNGMIRATYGHSVDVKLNLHVDTKVKTLFHGTAKEVLQKILAEGLKPMNRRYVHLSDNFEDAVIVARRKSARVVVLIINAEKLRARGFEIYRAGKNTFLVSYVPPDCIEKFEIIS